MNDRTFNEEQLRDREQLLLWMENRNMSFRDLATATGDFASAIYMMTKGDRVVNDAFKWRFRRAFGDAEASAVFPERELA